MILLNENMDRLIKRRALGLTTAVVSEDLCSEDAVMLEVDEDGRKLVLRRATDEEAQCKAEDFSKNNSEDEILIIADEFSPVANLDESIMDSETILEVTFLGDNMLITLDKGAIYIREPYGKDEVPEVNYLGMVQKKPVMLAYRNTPELDEEDIRVDNSLNWITTQRLRGIVGNWCEENFKYVDDYIFVISVSASRKGKNDGVISVKPIDMYDISIGELDRVKQRYAEAQSRIHAKEVQEQIREASLTVEKDEDIIDLGEDAKYTQGYTDYVEEYEDEYDEEYVGVGDYSPDEYYD